MNERIVDGRVYVYMYEKISPFLGTFVRYTTRMRSPFATKQVRGASFHRMQCGPALAWPRARNPQQSESSRHAGRKRDGWAFRSVKSGAEARAPRSAPIHRPREREREIDAPGRTDARNGYVRARARGYLPACERGGGGSDAPMSFNGHFSARLLTAISEFDDLDGAEQRFLQLTVLSDCLSAHKKSLE